MSSGESELLKDILRGEPPAVEPPTVLMLHVISLISDQRQQQVVKECYGIGTLKKTRHEISRNLSNQNGTIGISPARVTQILNRSLVLLRKPEIKMLLRPYVLSWQEKWALLEKDLQSRWGISSSIPKEWNVDDVDNFHKQHHTLNRKDVFDTLWGSTEELKRWQSQKWRRQLFL